MVLDGVREANVEANFSDSERCGKSRGGRFSEDEGASAVTSRWPGSSPSLFVIELEFGTTVVFGVTKLAPNFSASQGRMVFPKINRGS